VNQVFARPMGARFSFVAAEDDEPGGHSSQPTSLAGWASRPTHNREYD
jgi:hypothetical protein